jgi:hypothetical protein
VFKKMSRAATSTAAIARVVTMQVSRLSIVIPPDMPL